MRHETALAVTVTLVLNQREAEWLNGVMQNPLWADESREDSEMRQLFWNATKTTVPPFMTGQ
jgi:hypothetical protein